MINAVMAGTEQLLYTSRLRDDLRSPLKVLVLRFAFPKKKHGVVELVVLLLRVLPLPERLLLVIDDSPTKRYGPKVEGADIHHNPTPGPADQPYLYGHDAAWP